MESCSDRDDTNDTVYVKFSPSVDCMFFLFIDSVAMLFGLCGFLKIPRA